MSWGLEWRECVFLYHLNQSHLCFPPSPPPSSTQWRRMVNEALHALSDEELNAQMDLRHLTYNETTTSTWSTTGWSAGGDGMCFKDWVHPPLGVATCSLTSATPRALQGTEQATRNSKSRAEAKQRVRWRTTANATSKLMSLHRRSAGKA